MINVHIHVCHNGVPCHADGYVPGMLVVCNNQALQISITVTGLHDDCYITCTLFTKREQLAFFDFPLSLNISSCGESPAGTTLTLQVNYAKMILHVILNKMHRAQQDVSSFSQASLSTRISHKKLPCTVHIKDNRSV